MGAPSFEPRTKKGLSELCQSLDSLYGRHYMLNILARNENFERLRKISGLYANELYVSDRISKGIGSFSDVIRHGYI